MENILSKHFQIWKFKLSIKSNFLLMQLKKKYHQFKLKKINSNRIKMRISINKKVFLDKFY